MTADYDYVTLYKQTAFAGNYDLAPFFGLMFLFMGRMLPIIAMAPFFGGKVLPHPVKVTFAISLFAVFLPELSALTKTELGFNLQLVLFLAKEVFVGVLLGFLIGIPFMIVQNAGILIDHQRGGASLMVNDPTIQNQSSPLGTLFNLILIYLFFLIDGPFTILTLISLSYTILPPDQFLSHLFFEPNSKVLDTLMGMLGHVMILSTQLATPALIMILMTDFFLGIANRLAPQVQITFLGMPLKSLLALVIVFFGWRLFNEEVMIQVQKSMNELFLLVQEFKPASS